MPHLPTAVTVALWIVCSASGAAQATASEPPSTLEGFTEPYRDLQIGSADTGVIAQLHVDPGQTVRATQELARLDDRALMSSLEVARQVAQMDGEYQAARHHYEAKQRHCEQAEGLHQRGHATEQELWHAQSERDEAAARLQAAQEQQQRRVLELRHAETMLERAIIRSPIDGVVIDRLKDVGEVVSPADPQLLRIVQLDPLRITASGPAAQLATLRAGMVLPVWIGKARATATVEYVSPVVDAGSGMSSVQLRLPNPDLAIAGGLACRVGVQPSGDEAPSPQSQREVILRQTMRRFPFLNRSTR